MSEKTNDYTVLCPICKTNYYVVKTDKDSVAAMRAGTLDQSRCAECLAKTMK